MKWANHKYQRGMRKEAKPKSKGYCPLCFGEVISKCGEINIWHWAHKSNFQCDSFGEPESKWHLNWKGKFPKECQEFIIGKHRADIRTKDRLIIELQNSPISSESIYEREQYYKKMIWILNGETLAKNIQFFKRRYKWKWFPKSWEYAEKRVYVDLGDYFLYLLDFINSQGTFSKISKDAFIVNHGGKL
ncbi:hypothetical protein LCGC14_0861120 [marine sediment metagenome]|uniref:Competence protein CoiA-like family protein n=1 Tax=marine sediment metagenome TaxID=412755 RepID=A0A0F9PSU9_9ZZZZ